MPAHGVDLTQSWRSLQRRQALCGAACLLAGRMRLAAVARVLLSPRSVPRLIPPRYRTAPAHHWAARRRSGPPSARQRARTDAAPCLADPPPRGHSGRHRRRCALPVPLLPLPPTSPQGDSADRFTLLEVGRLVFCWPGCVRPGSGGRRVLLPLTASRGGGAPWPWHGPWQPQAAADCCGVVLPPSKAAQCNAPVAPASRPASLRSVPAQP